MDGIRKGKGRRRNSGFTGLLIIANIYIPTMEYYPALEREGILKRATTWINLEDIMRGEISQTQKDKYCVIPLL